MKSATLRPSFVLAALPLFLATGCPHRSPVWSPDGSRLLVLGGQAGEEVDKAASSLWIADVAKKTAQALQCPEKGVRYLAAAWLDAGSFAVATGSWQGGSIAAGSEKLWRVSAAGGAWKALACPTPSESRITRQLMVPIREGSAQALVYPSGDEDLVVAELDAGKTLRKLEHTHLIGPGPKGGFLCYRPAADDETVVEVAAFGADLAELWHKKLSALRDAIAQRLGKKPVEVVMTEPSTSHLPLGGESGWVGVSIVFLDVGWKEGVPGYYLRLDEKTGDVLAATRAVGLWGRPASAAGAAWAVLAPDAKAKLPVRVEQIRVDDGKTMASAPLEGVAREAMLGYSTDPTGKRLAISIAGSAAQVRLLGDGLKDPPAVIDLK
jgi:hypothetical protein